MQQKLDLNYLETMSEEAIRSLETEQGILASSKNEAYGCIFGRDSLISGLKLLKVDKQLGTKKYFPLLRKILINLCQLQGTRRNIESGEQPGKMIHEFRPKGHEHLTVLMNPPWYVYENQVLRNYDSVDSTPLFLILLYRYWQASSDSNFLAQVLPNAEAALNWIIDSGDGNQDGLIDYELPENRKFGGLITQNWMDSSESVFHETGGKIIYPLAPIEVQAYAWLALTLWSNYYEKSDLAKAANLRKRAEELKKLVVEKFSSKDPAGNWFLANKIDGRGRRFRSVRSNMGHCLWASLNEKDDGKVDSVIDSEQAKLICSRLMHPDMFSASAGIRTLSSFSEKYNPISYHNGSIWPHDNGMIAEGFENFGFFQESELVKRAILTAIAHFKTPIELYGFDHGGYLDYVSESGQKACRVQAWSAATILDFSISLK